MATMIVSHKIRQPFINPSHPQSIWRWCCNATVGPWAMRMDGLLAPPIGSGDVCTILVSLLPSVPLNGRLLFIASFMKVVSVVDRIGIGTNGTCARSEL